MATRLKGRFGYPRDEPFRVTFHPDRLDFAEKLAKKGGRVKRVFVCSMGDLFHHNVRSEWRTEILKEIRYYDTNDYLILTKRPENIGYDSVTYDWGVNNNWPSHVYLGVSAENQQTADERIPILLQIPAAKRFVSIEPMLGPVDLKLRDYAVSGNSHSVRRVFIDWVIVGGLSLKREWLDSIVEQCSDSGVPIFLKDNAQYPIERKEFPATTPAPATPAGEEER
jgi:protein gp37